MKNSEGYRDPTAGNAMNQKPKSQQKIVAPPKKKRIKPNVTEHKPITVYYAKPVYVSK